MGCYCKCAGNSISYHTLYTRSKTSGFNVNVLKTDMNRCSPVDAVSVPVGTGRYDMGLQRRGGTGEALEASRPLVPKTTGKPRYDWL